MALAWAALSLLAGLLGLLALLSPVAAQSVTLVSNANQGLDTSSTTRSDRAQAFTTGAADATLSSVEIISEDPQGDDVAVSLCPVNSANRPASPCTALTAPSSFAAGTLVFTAPDGTTLAANTTYSLLITSPGRDHLVLDVTRSVAEDAGGTAGWSIANNFDSSPAANAWTTHPMRALRITIKDASSNNAPTVATEIPDRTATAGAAFSYAFPDNTFADVDAGDTLTYTATKSDDSALPSWLGFAAATRTFSGTPQAADVGTVSVKVTASDGTDSVSDTFDIVVNVAGTNNAPTVATVIPDRTATVGATFSYAFPANTFNDADAGDTLTYTATKSDDSALPSWLSFDAATRTFSGTPAAADARTVSVKVTASDGTYSVSDTFDIVVSASANNAPTAADKTVTTAQDTKYTFTPFDFDFGYVDADDDPLVSVLIVTVPAEGALALNGVAVMAPQTVTRGAISDGHLKFEPADGASGDPYTIFTFKVNDGTEDSVSAYTMTIDVMIVSAPDAPTGLTATASGQGWIELAWTAPVHAGGSAITGYRIEVSPDGSSWSDLVAATASTATTYVHKGLSAGATRHYRVSAINVVRTSDPSDSDDATTRTDEQLVSNFNYRGAADNIQLTVQNVVGIFTTGSSAANLNSIELKLGKYVNRTVAPTLKLHVLNVVDGRATLGSEVATLATPSTSLTANSFRTFSYEAPSGTSLTASQAYIFVLEPPSMGIVLVETTTDPSEDTVKADGWTIDGSDDGESPYFIDPRKQIVFRVNGTTGGATNNAPVFSSSNVSRSIAENTAAGQNVGAAVAATDADAGDTLTYTLGGTDMASFDIVGDSGQIRTKSGVSYDHEAKSSYTVTVTASDGAATAVATVTISVTDVDEPPDAPAQPTVNAVSGSTTSLSVSWAAPANAGKPDIANYDVQYRAGSSGTWSDGPEDVTTTTTTITSLATDTAYQARVRATNAEGDSGWSDPPGSGRTNMLTNTAPVFNPSSVSRSIAENTAAGQNVGAAVTATDADTGDTLGYALGGADAASFDFVESSGQIRTKTNVSYDFEAKSSYTVTVTASDGAATAVATVTISVTDVDEPPDAPAQPTVNAVSGSTTSLSVSWAAPANAGKPDIANYDVQYRAGSSGTWSDGPEDVTTTTTTITSLATDTAYQARVRATNAEGDSGWSDPPGSGRTNMLTNTAPVFNPSSVSRSIAENTAAGQNVGAAVTATDADTGDTLGYALGGADAASFDFVESSGQIRTKTNVSYDFEAKSSYTVTVTASDGAATADASVTIGITDVDEPPSAPAQPTVNAVSGSTTSLAVSWVAPANAGKPAIASYDLQYRVSGVVAWTDGPEDVAGTSTTVASLVADTLYEVQVRATNAEGDGAWSVPGTGTSGTVTPVIITGGGGGGGGGGPTPSEVDFEWNVKRDIEELDGGNDRATGVWSDGTTLWVADNADGAGDAVYAYNRESGERVEEREFALHNTNRAPRGIWSDGETAWVSDSGRERLFAYRLADGERVEEREFALAERNSDARGIWSDEETMWVLDSRADALFVYDFESGELLGEYELDAANDDPRGVWSDGVTIWVSDHGAKRLFAYRLPVLPDAETDPGEEDADDDARELERVRDEEFSMLSRASNNSPRGIWSGGDVMYVADESDDRVYSYNMPDAADARLASLTLSGVDTGEFDPGRTEYEAVVADGVTATTVEAEAIQRRTDVAIDPPDADVEADGHQVALQDLGEITVTVTSADGSRTKTYRVRLGEEEAAGPVAGCLRGDIAVGFSLVVYAGGSIEDLVACAEGRNVAALYVLDGGEWVSYIVGAPELVNRSFAGLFAEGLAALTPLIARSDGPASPGPSGDAPRTGDATQPWPACLQGEIAEGFNLVVYEERQRRGA